VSSQGALRFRDRQSVAARELARALDAELLAAQLARPQRPAM
jgi:hypothetical protein